MHKSQNQCQLTVIRHKGKKKLHLLFDELTIFSLFIFHKLIIPCMTCCGKATNGFFPIFDRNRRKRKECEWTRERNTDGEMESENWVKQWVKSEIENGGEGTERMSNTLSTCMYCTTLFVCVSNAMCWHLVLFLFSVNSSLANKQCAISRPLVQTVSQFFFLYLFLFIYSFI